MDHRQHPASHSCSPSASLSLCAHPRRGADPIHSTRVIRHKLPAPRRHHSLHRHSLRPSLLPGAALHRRVHERWRCTNRLRPRRLSRHLLHQRPQRANGARRQEGKVGSLPQQPRRHLHRRHRQSRRRKSLLGHGSSRRRLQQRRPAQISSSPASAESSSIATTATAPSPMSPNKPASTSIKPGPPAPPLVTTTTMAAPTSSSPATSIST